MILDSYNVIVTLCEYSRIVNWRSESWASMVQPISLVDAIAYCDETHYLLYIHIIVRVLEINKV